MQQVKKQSHKYSNIASNPSCNICK